MKRRLALIFAVLATPLAAKPSPPVPVKLPAVGPSNITPPKPLGNPGDWITSDDYPAAAMRNGETGDVRVTLAVDATGKVTDCSVTESSGHQTLDDATCAVLMARSRFAPAYDEQLRPVASSFRRMVRWTLPVTREIWTLDQIRFPPPKDPKILASLTGATTMDIVVQRLKALGIAFDRGTAQLDTAAIPRILVWKIDQVPATQPFLLPQAGLQTVSIIKARKPADFNGSVAKPFPLSSPFSSEAVVAYDVGPDGKPANCVAKGEAPSLLAFFAGLCLAFQMEQTNFSPDTSGQTRHVTMTLQTSVTSAPTSPSPPPEK